MNNGIIYNGNTIGKNLSTGHYSIIRNDNIIGDNVRIGSYTEIAHHCIISDYVSIHSGCFVSEYTQLKERCWIGPHVKLINDKYPQTNNKNKAAPIIGKRSIIGANSVIMPGIEIGDDCLIGAGSVVSKNVPDGEVWVGNPAKFLKKRSDLDAYSIM